jgi:two-component system, NarL family, sensor kinase
MRTFIPIFFLLISLECFCAKATHAAEPMRALADSCMIFLQRSDTAQARRLLEKILPFANSASDGFLKGDIFRIAGNYHVEKWNYSLAEFYFEQAALVAGQLEKDDKNILQASVLFNRAKIYHHNGDFETALTLCLEAEHLYDLSDHHEGLAETHNRLGGIYMLLGQIEKQQYHNLRAYQEALLSNNNALISKTLNAYGNYLLYNNNADSAIRCYNQAIASAIASDNKKVVSDAYYNKAFAFSKEGNYPKALDGYTEALRWARRGNLLYDIADAQYKIGLTHYYMKQFEIARDTLIAALSMAEGIGSKILERNIYDVLSFLEAEAGNVQQAYEYLNKYIDVAFDLVGDEGRQQVNFLDAKFQSEKKENEILRQKHSIQRRNYIIFVAVLLLITILITGILLIQKFRNKQTISRQQAEIKDQMIRELEKEKALIAVQSTLIGEEAERTRIARDLHDGLGGMLSGVKLTLNNMKGKHILDEESAELFKHALKLIDTSAKELRKVAHNMMPEILIRSGLSEALDNYCRSLLADGSVEVSFSFYGNAYRLSQGFELMVYRVGQELLNNALKHSGASMISVELIQAEQHVSMSVNDNGKGFDSGMLAQGSGSGLANIRARITSYEGVFDISSSPGKGTEAMAAFHQINQYKV